MPAPTLTSLLRTALAPRRRLPPARAHLVGVAGSGMASLAEVLEQAGWELTGSDLVARPRGRFPVFAGHSAEHVSADLDFVIHTPAVDGEQVELAAARRLGVPVMSYPEMLGRLMQLGWGLAVAGTHGKSTVTAMAAEVLLAAGLDPTVLVGACPVGRSSGGRLGAGATVLVEACEYRGHFLHLAPAAAVLLGIEPDHFDCFPSGEHLEGAFSAFVDRLPADGLLLASDGCPTTRRIAARAGCPVEFFGLDEASPWRAAQVIGRRGYYHFELVHQERSLGTVKLAVPGRHNVINAVAAAALSGAAGASPDAIVAGLERFAGLHRRLELLGSSGGVWLVDDYAHLPAEVAATLDTVREMFPGRQVCCVFQPHQASRTARLLDPLAQSLQNADTLLVAEVFRARESDATDAEATAADLARRAAAGGVKVLDLHDPDQIEAQLARRLRPGDVLVTIGAGDIGRIAHGLGKRFRKHLAPR